MARPNFRERQRLLLQLEEPLLSSGQLSNPLPPLLLGAVQRKHRRSVEQESIVLFHHRYSRHQRSLYRQRANRGYHVAQFPNRSIFRCGANSEETLQPRSTSRLPTLRHEYAFGSVSILSRQCPERRDNRIFPSNPSLQPSHNRTHSAGKRYADARTKRRQRNPFPISSPDQQPGPAEHRNHSVGTRSVRRRRQQ